MSNYYLSQDPPEETPVQNKTQPVSGHFRTCYLCGLDFSQHKGNFSVARAYGEFTLRHYVITVCIWCNHQHFREII